eukprot:scaffold69901_cov15-Tisochrysis_lutea.AAC.1
MTGSPSIKKLAPVCVKNTFSLKSPTPAFVDLEALGCSRDVFCRPGSEHLGFPGWENSFIDISFATRNPEALTGGSLNVASHKNQPFNMNIAGSVINHYAAAALQHEYYDQLKLFQHASDAVPGFLALVHQIKL